MILIGDKLYELGEPTMKEFRLILEFDHYKRGKTDIYDEVSKLMQLLVVIYNEQFTIRELQRGIEDGSIIYELVLDSIIASKSSGVKELYQEIGNKWVELQDESKTGIIGFRNYATLLTQARQIEINYYRGSYTSIKNTTKSGVGKVEQDNKEVNISAIRNNLALHYKNLIYLTNAYTLGGVDSMTVSDFEYLIDTATVEQVQRVTPLGRKQSSSLAEKLKVRKAGYNKAEV